MLDIPWDVVRSEEEDEHEVITATHPKIPIPIGIHVTKQFAHITMETGVPTDAMTVEDRMRLYKKLLHMNTNLVLMKTGLVGEEHKVVISVDLDLASLNKSEFNDALTALIFGAPGVIDALGFTDELSEMMITKVAEMVAEKIMGGEDEKAIMEFLIHRVGMEGIAAKEFMKSVLESIGKHEKADELDLVYIQ